ncbi:hypothetical protein F9802_15165 [Bacillus aerolatus]|uniref:DUF4367 domain-containing protein n=1 Tax=Bacillus aerolatus TaxID=2653354 RepID=A0A6I1FC82_9BACI|nr:hypothetical protein [Bacillus aerolatus]KAB7704903.1 hypothetical protein F9802_15165 [Bacillus aerolatus]
MNKSISFVLFVCSILVLGINNETTYANSNDKPQPLEEIYPKIGYKTAEEAIKDFERHFKQNLELPLRIPPINFTHNFGRFSDLDGDVNDSLEVIFVNDKSPQNHYKIDVRPVKDKIPISDKYVLRNYTLKNKNKALYMNISGLNVLAFETDNWQYMLGIDKRVSDKVTPEVLVEIANSINR